MASGKDTGALSGVSERWRKALGDNIKALRERKGWSQDELIQQLRLLSGDEFYRDKASISEIESGNKEPPWWKMVCIARVFGTTIEALIGLDSPGSASNLIIHGTGEHAVIQQFEGHYCAHDHGQLERDVADIKVSLAQVVARLDAGESP